MGRTLDEKKFDCKTLYSICPNIVDTFENHVELAKLSLSDVIKKVHTI